MPRSSRLRILVLLVAVVTLVVPCGAARAAGPPTRARAWVARLVGVTDAYISPSARARRERTLQPVTGWSRSPAQLLVLDARHGWLRVRLPMRAGHRAGWIRADDVVLTRTRWRIEVSLRRRLVRVLHGGRVRWRFHAVVGAPGTPTPRGTFAIAERVKQPTARGFDGAWVLFLTAFSERVPWFDGNDGQVALHGRGGASLRDPLGTARSHGCVRLSNRAVALIARHVGDGTPVAIH